MSEGDDVLSRTFYGSRMTHDYFLLFFTGNDRAAFRHFCATVPNYHLCFFLFCGATLAPLVLFVFFGLSTRKVVIAVILFLLFMTSVSYAFSARFCLFLCPPTPMHANGFVACVVQGFSWIKGRAFTCPPNHCFLSTLFVCFPRTMAIMFLVVPFVVFIVPYQRYATAFRYPPSVV